MKRRKRTRVSPGRSLLVLALGGLVSGAVELAAAFPEYAHLIAFAACVLAPVANQLRAAVEREDALALPEKRDVA